MKLTQKIAGASLLLFNNRAASVVNTVAPSHDYEGVSPNVGDTITGTAGEWTGSPTLTYQWRMGATAETATDISGATSLNFTTTDSEFGQILWLFEIPNGSVEAAAVSAATARMAEAPVQSLGAELYVDGNMEAVGVAAWTAILATLTKETGSPHGGAQVIRVDASGSVGRARQTIQTIGDYMYGTGAARGDGVNGVPRVADGVFLGTNSASWQEYHTLYRAHAATVDLHYNSDSGYAEFDDISFKKVTPNTQLTAPSANMRLSFYYTLPGSPVEGDCVWLLPRISDFASGNYWLGFLRWTGSQWDVNLYSVASHTRTSRIAASNIAATNGLRVNMNGTALELFTTANGGGAWTSRGTFTSSTYQTAVGCNVLHTSDVVAGVLSYAPAA